MRPRYIIATLAVLVAVLVWTTRWQYFQWENHVLRVNRWTGHAYELRKGGVWTDGSLYSEWKANNPAP